MECPEGIITSPGRGPKPLQSDDRLWAKTAPQMPVFLGRKGYRKTTQKSRVKVRVYRKRSTAATVRAATTSSDVFSKVICAETYISVNAGDFGPSARYG